MGRVTGFEPAGEPAFRLPSRQRPIVRASGAKRPLVQLARRKKESPYSLRNTDLKYRNSIDANASRFLPKTKSKPSAAGSIWKGGARERANDVFFCHRHKKTSEQSGLCSDVEHPNTIDANAPGFLPKTKSKPSAAGSIWKGGARERADDVFFAIGIKRRRSKADFAPTCRVLTEKMQAQSLVPQGFAGF